jgi:deoxycytidine triphosphate deaminase
MALLTDVDIKKALGKDIVIEPFSVESLTPVGYDFTVGDFVYSLEHGLVEPSNDCYMLPPKSTVQILTKESLWVSGRLAGTFHSKVSLVSKGLSHISTTLDPGWYGPLLVTVRNNMDREFPLKVGSSFVTLVFFKVSTPTKTPSLKPEFRKDILIAQLNNQTEQYIKKIQATLGNSSALEEFRLKVEEANRPMFKKVWSSVQTKGRRELGKNISTALLVIAFCLIATAPLYWNQIKGLFDNINYDSQITSVQFSLLLAIAGGIFFLWRK